MKILFSLPDKRVRGGPPSHLYILHDTLKEQGVDIRGFIYGGRTSDEGKIRKISGRFWDMVYFPFLISRHRPDIIQLNSAYDRKGVLRDVVFAPLARILGQTVIVKFHGSDLGLLANKHWFWRFGTWVVVRSSELVCLLSHEEKADWNKRFPRAQFAVVKNALDFNRYNDHSGFRRRYGIPDKKPLLLFIARFISVKGLKEVIMALPAILRHHDVHAVFVGDGPVRAENEALCRKLELEQYTTFTGYIPEQETVPAYLSSDLLVFPTYHQEGMPMAIFHSLACGLPIITTRIRAAADWLEERKHCLFVPPRDPDKVAQAVVYLLDHPELRAEMGQNGQKLVQKFEKTKVAEEFASLYKSLLTNGRM